MGGAPFFFFFAGSILLLDYSVIILLDAISNDGKPNHLQQPMEHHVPLSFYFEIWHGKWSSDMKTVMWGASIRVSLDTWPRSLAADAPTLPAAHLNSNSSPIFTNSKKLEMWVTSEDFHLWFKTSSECIHKSIWDISLNQSVSEPLCLTSINQRMLASDRSFLTMVEGAAIAAEVGFNQRGLFFTLFGPPRSRPPVYVGLDHQRLLPLLLLFLFKEGSLRFQRKINARAKVI